MSGARPTHARLLLGSAGAALVLVGAWQAVAALQPAQLVGLALWLAAAVVVHDGLIAPAVAVLTVIARRAGRPLPAAVRRVVTVGGVVVAVVSLVVLPEVAAKAQGTTNSTVLTGDYAARLGWLWLGAGTVLAVTAAVVTLRAVIRRRVRIVRGS